MSTPKRQPKPAMKRTGGMQKAEGAGIHPVAAFTTPSEQTPADLLSRRDSTPAAQSVNSEREQFQVRLPRDLLIRLGVYAAENRLTKRDIAETAIVEFLERQGAWPPR